MFLRRNRIMHTAFIFGLALVFALVAWAVQGGSRAHAQTPTPTETATPTATATPNTGCILTINKNDDPDTVPEGGQITYTLKIENTGNDDCFDMIVTDTIPTDTDCVSATVVDEPSGVDIDVDGCDTAGDVEWTTDDTVEPDDEIELRMVVKLTSGAEEDDEITNTACVTAEREVEVCDTERTDVGAAPTATAVPPTATSVPTVPPPPPVVPTVPPPPPAPLPTLVAPPTGSGPSPGTTVFWAVAAGMGAIGCLLLLSGGVVWSRRLR